MNRTSKNCVICGAEFSREKGVSTRVWEKRRCCCRNCSDYLRRKPVGELARQAKGYVGRRIESEKGVKTTYR